MLKIDHRIASAYHPQTNELQERFNQTLERSLVKYVNDEQNDWDLHIDRILFAYRTAVHASTDVSPFKAMFMRDPILPIHLHMSQNKEEILLTTEESVKEVTEKVCGLRKVAEEKMTRNILKAQCRQKRSYDRRHTSKQNGIVEGSLVLLKNNKNSHRMGGKLEARYIGPYEVISVLPKGRAKLKNIASGKELKSLHHMVNLKLYKQSDEHNEDDMIEGRDTEVLY